MTTAFFDAAYYLARNPDVLAAGYTLATAEQHYIKYGAAESLTDASRAPNAWFDARAYLAAYPDLVANGVTAANAFYHYITYGINEGRSPAANVNPADFSYSSYAAANGDLRTAFGIIDPAHLTVLQQHELLAQYLSYGIHEGRSGAATTVAGSFFTPPAPPGISAPPVPPAPPIIINPAGVYAGTDGNDVFKGADLTLNGSTLDGKLGIDTLQAQLGINGASITLTSIEKIEVSLDTNIGLTTFNVSGSGVNSLTVSDQGQAFLYTGAKVDTLTLLTSGGATIATFTDASGSADHLNVNIAAGVTTILSPDGIENFGVNLGANSSLNLLPSGVQSSSMTVALTGGAAGATGKLVVSTGGAIPQLNVDGSAFAGNLILNADTGSRGTNVTLTGSAGNDTLTGFSDINHTTTLIGGAGNDILVASAGQDLMTGGPGNDSFRFGPGTAAPISLVAGAGTVDTLFGLASGDTIEFAGSGASIATYARSDATLALAVAAVEAAIHIPNINALFTLGTQAYFINSGDGTTAAAIIKLIMADNAPFTGQMVADAGGAHFVN